MDEAEISLIQKSYQRIEPTLPRLARYFYTRLFELDSSLESILDTDRKNDGELFTALFKQVLNSLEQLDQLNLELKLLGDKMIYFHVSKDHLQTIGAVFVDTLAFGFGNNFTPNIMRVWVKLYKKVSAQLIDVAGL